MKRYSFNGLAGCVQQRRSQRTKTLVGVYNIEQADMGSDPDCAWAVVCEKHGAILYCQTLATAKHDAVDPSGWCDECRGDEPIGEFGV